MPNWIEGTLKLRGRREDIGRFFREGLDASAWPNPKDRENQVEDNSTVNNLDFCFRNEPHIAGTRRAFITDEYAYMDEDYGIICVNIKQAWYFCESYGSEDMQVWKTISEKYNVDLRLFGIEMGQAFVQELIIVRGKRPILNEKQYEDWMWECPFPMMGG
jgi:hypothetical protein